MRPYLGVLFAAMYLIVAGYLIGTQGLFGESFIAILLGMPWALVPSFFEYGGQGGSAVMYFLVLGPIALNAAILYWIGRMFR